MTAQVLDQERFAFSLRAIYFRGSRLTMAPSFDPLVPGQELLAQFRTEILPEAQVSTFVGPETQQPAHACRFVNRFEFRYVLRSAMESIGESGIKDEQACIVITADIAAHYFVNRPEVPAASVLADWGRTSAVIHCWPYWREYCHSAMVRMSLPVSMIPMMDIQAMLDSVKPGETAADAGPPASVGALSGSIRKVKKKQG